MRVPLLAVVLVLVPAAAAVAAVLLNEVLYDPAGADGGHEFVELINAGAGAAALDGLVLEFANGAVGDVWEVRWRGAAGEVLAPGARWLIVDRGWSGPAFDAEVSLGLQNGPDAVRLRRDEAVVDLLGWGALAYAALSEGPPHPGAPSGSSLARRPDGADSDRNDLDWHVVDEPTPGAPNVEARSLRLLTAELEPPSAQRPDLPLTLRVALENDGLEAHPGGAAVLADAAGLALATSPLAPATPGEATSCELVWRCPGPGRLDLWLRAVAADAVDTFVFAAGSAWAGEPDVALAEIMPVPESGAPEWVELLAPPGRGLRDLDGWTLEDDGGTRVALPPRLVPDGDRLLLAPDAGAWLAWHRDLTAAGARWSCTGLDPALILEEASGGWPTLNNAAGAGEERADRLVLRDPDGVAVDWVAWGGRFAAPTQGRSLERLAVVPTGSPARNWAPAVAAAGATPGCRNSVAETGADGAPLAATPRRFGAGGTNFAFRLGTGEASWNLAVLDLDGRRVRALGGDALGPGRRVVPWDGSDDRGEPLRPGPWLALLRVRDATGALRRRATLVVVRVRP